MCVCVELLQLYSSQELLGYFGPDRRGQPARHALSLTAKNTPSNVSKGHKLKSFVSFALKRKPKNDRFVLLVQ